MTKENCKHQCGGRATYDYYICEDCGSILTDGGWGIASRKWFKDKREAEFYQENGYRPKDD